MVHLHITLANNKGKGGGGWGGWHCKPRLLAFPDFNFLETFRRFKLIISLGIFKRTYSEVSKLNSYLIKFLFLAMQWNKTLNEIIGTEVFLELIVLLDINQLRR